MSDSAFVATVPPGAYTAHVTGTSGATGIALVEIYEMRRASSSAGDRC